MIAIRPAALPDAPGLAVIHVDTWRAAYGNGLMPQQVLDDQSVEDRTVTWRERLESPMTGVSTLVAEVDGELIGFIIVGPRLEPPVPAHGEIYALYVAPSHWGTGAGRALHDAGVSAMRAEGKIKAALWTLVGNRRAEAFYAAQGWEPTGVERSRELFGFESGEHEFSLDLT